METTKDQLVKTIKEWVKLDNEIRALKKEEEQRKNDKKRISENLMSIMRDNQIDCFDLKDGQICYSKKNVKKPITTKTLINILAKYYKGDISKATELNEFILENREEVIKETLVRKIAKDED
jgi:hypothetical protein